MDSPHSLHAPVKRLVGFIVPGEDTTNATTRHPPSFGFRLSGFGLLSAFAIRPSDSAAKARPCRVTPRPPNASNSLATSPLWRCQTETEPSAVRVTPITFVVSAFNVDATGIEAWSE